MNNIIKVYDGESINSYELHISNKLNSFLENIKKKYSIKEKVTYECGYFDIDTIKLEISDENLKKYDEVIPKTCNYSGGVIDKNKIWAKYGYAQSYSGKAIGLFLYL